MPNGNGPSYMCLSSHLYCRDNDFLDEESCFNANETWISLLTIVCNVEDGP